MQDQMQSQLIDVRKLVIASPPNMYQSAKVYHYPSTNKQHDGYLILKSDS